VLVLSLLIIAALAVAVASFFVAGTQWLLFGSAGLIVLAFYVSRRTSRGQPDPEVEHSATPARGQLSGPINELALDESGRDRDGTNPADLNDSSRQPEAGRAIAG
jgi:membrane protein implicated in regulation of membrane protease activity